MIKFRFHFVISIVTTMSLLLAACSVATVMPTATATTTASDNSLLDPTFVCNQPSGTISLTDGLNRSVTLQGPAQKIVSLAPSNTELLYEVGAGAQVIGRDEFSDFPLEAVALPSVGGSMGNYDLQAIAALKPDLVLAAQINTLEQVSSLENLGLTVFYLSNPEHLVDLYKNLQIVGCLTGKADQAEALVESLGARITAIIDKLPEVTTHYKVYYELDATDPTMPYTAGPGSYINIILENGGDQNIASSLTSPFAQISSDEVIQQNPDFIFLGDSAYGVTIENVMARPGWSEINAVKNNQVYLFDNDIISRPTARIVDAIEMLVKMIHPDVFK
jgi:iron complex transport system substrate-binding protein